MSYDQRKNLRLFQTVDMEPLEEILFFNLLVLQSGRL